MARSPPRAPPRPNIVTRRESQFRKDDNGNNDRQYESGHHGHICEHRKYERQDQEQSAKANRQKDLEHADATIMIPHVVAHLRMMLAVARRRKGDTVATNNDRGSAVMQLVRSSSQSPQQQHERGYNKECNCDARTDSVRESSLSPEPSDPCRNDRHCRQHVSRGNE